MVQMVGFCYKRSNKNWKCINNLMLILCIQSAILLKARLWRMRFLVNCASFLILQFYCRKTSGKEVLLWILEFFSGSNFIKNETPAEVFSREFWEVFQPATLLKPRPRHRRFPVNFAKLLTTPILQNICEELLLMIWLLLDSFVNFIVH